MFKKTTLKNGLRIITVPQKEAKACTVLVLAGTGSKYETKKISGISHFLEHLMFKGTEKRPTHIDIAEPLDEIGGVYNAFTGEEYTGYYAKVDAGKFELALDIISDIFLNAKLDPQEIEKEKGVIIEEINMMYDHPMSYIGVLWSKLLYGDQPAGWDIAGTKESVAGIKREDIVAYRQSQYVAENSIVCLSGKIPSEKECATLVKKYFSKINSGKISPKPKVLEDQRKPAVLLQRRETDQTHLHLGVRAFNVFHKDKVACEVLGVLLGGMMSSRLFVKIREELGLAYYISASAYSDSDTGCLVTQAGVDNSKAEKAVAAIVNEYKKLLQTPVSAKELKKAKDHMIGKMSLVLETSDALASFYGRQEIIEKKISTQKQICDKINKVTQADISRVAKEIFKPEDLNLAIIGPFDSEEKFQNLLKL